MSAIEKAISAAGSQAVLAQRCGVVQSAVAAWLRRGRVPAEYCPAIEQHTGVRCEELRPDVAWHVVRAKAALPHMPKAA